MKWMKSILFIVLATLLCLSAASAQNLPPTYTDDNGIEFVLIPAGSFLMGCSGFEPCDSDEEPQHRVTITRPFYMGKFEVTQEQWVKVMGYNDSEGVKDRQYPVNNVSWLEVQKFVGRLNETAGARGYRYRLPTEAEWEYAARAGSTAAYCFGDAEGELDRYAWYDRNSGGGPHPVGQKQPNAWGLYDMHGNVWEWVWDWYDKNYYKYSRAEDPLGPDSGGYRVLRGGSWDYVARDCRSANRLRYWPGNRGNFGLRLALFPGH